MQGSNEKPYDVREGPLTFLTRRERVAERRQEGKLAIPMPDWYRQDGIVRTSMHQPAHSCPGAACKVLRFCIQVRCPPLTPLAADDQPTHTFLAATAP